MGVSLIIYVVLKFKMSIAVPNAIFHLTTWNTIFMCDAWENWRRQVCAEMDVEELSPDNLIRIMHLSSRNWTLVSKLLTKIISTREKEERARQSQTAERS